MDEVAGHLFAGSFMESSGDVCVTCGGEYRNNPLVGGGVTAGLITQSGRRLGELKIKTQSPKS